MNCYVNNIKNNESNIELAANRIMKKMFYKDEKNAERHIEIQLKLTIQKDYAI